MSPSAGEAFVGVWPACEDPIDSFCVWQFFVFKFASAVSINDDARLACHLFATLGL